MELPDLTRAAMRGFELPYDERLKKLAGMEDRDLAAELDGVMNELALFQARVTLWQEEGVWDELREWFEQGGAYESKEAA